MYNEQQLDNPVWFSLSNKESRFNGGNEKVKYFQHDVAPFLAAQLWDAVDHKMMQETLPEDRKFYVLKPGQIQLPEGFDVHYTTPIYQMVCHRFQPYLLDNIVVTPLENKNVPAMIDLAWRTKPGPYLERTIEFGPYISIQENGLIASMAGERMHLEGMTEISAVCTEPAYLGRGYASHLMSLLCDQIIERGETPFLHVRADNERAIKSYERLGFSIRTEVFFAIIQRSPSS
jgi:ribosomal protein S18 acetylase RimI-like enzyme